MPRTQIEKQSPYHIGGLSELLGIAIGGKPDTTPSIKDQEKWFLEQISLLNSDFETATFPSTPRKATTTLPKKNTTNEAGVSSFIRQYSDMRNSPWNCRFQNSTLDRFCRLVGSTLSWASVSKFENLKEWMGYIPALSDEMQLAEEGRKVVQKAFEEFKLQEQLGNSPELIARSLLLHIDSLEHLLLDESSNSWEKKRQKTIQQQHLDQLERLVRQKPADTLTTAFIKYFNASFTYDSNQLSTIGLTRKLLPTALQINQYLNTRTLEEEMLKLALDLKLNAMKAAWATNQAEVTASLNAEVWEAIQANLQHHTYETTQLYPYFFDYYAYSSCIDDQKLQEFYAFAQEAECPPRDRELHIFRALKCTACVKMRNKNYTEAGEVLAQLRSECQTVFASHGSFKALMAAYYYLRGTALYHQGNSYYVRAEADLFRALDNWNKSGLSKSIEAGYSYFLLGEIRSQAGEHLEAERFFVLAANIFAQSTKTNSCSFGYDQIKQLLDKKYPQRGF
ncbi:MAG: tetratricopeptide repeat protein [Runella sp.]